jgi:cytochrome c oxidase assembly protein subunit 15
MMRSHPDADPARLQRWRERTNGFTVTPRQYGYVAYAALGALTLIVLSGAAVRLTGSGLGCPDWPRCYGHAYPPLTTHAVIEFSNRLITVPVSLAAGAAWLLAWRRRPYRRDLVWLGALLPLGVVGQAVLGGFTVRGALDYGWVMSHFALSMLILAAATALTWRATHEPDNDEPAASERGRGHRAADGDRTASGAVDGDRAGGHRAADGFPAGGDRLLVWSVRALLLLGAVTIVAGTAATAAGPHAGGSPGQRINRLSFDGRATMDFVIHRHGELGLAFGLLAVGAWLLAHRRRRRADPVLRRSLTALCVFVALQGAVGLDQYETHLPTGLVWVHVGLACACWLSCLWATLAAGTPKGATAPLAEPRMPPRARVSV